MAVSPSDSGQESRWRTVALVVLAIALGAGIIYWLTHRPPPDAAAGGGNGGPGGRRPPTTVGVAKVAAADVPLTLDALGTVTPPVTAILRTRITGTLDKVLFTEGQRVAAGQLLAEVDPRPYALALEQARGTLARDEAQLAQARIDLKRYQTLVSQDSIAGQQADTQKALVGQLVGTVAADRAAVDAARLNLAYTRTVAPVAGRVGLRQVDVGNYVTPADTNGIVVLTQVQPIDVQFSLPEANLNAVQGGTRRGVVPVAAMDRGGGAVLAQGRFSTFDNRVDTTTGTVRAKARFANGDGALFPNQFVNVRVTYDVLRQVPVVPVAAVRNGPSGSFVYVVKPDRTAEKRAVRTSATSDGMVAITEGARVGETVVTEGADRLTDGGKVVLPGDKHPGMGGPGGNGGGSGRRHRSAAAA